MIDYIISELNKYRDEKRVKFANTSHLTNMKIIGVTNPNQKIILKEVKSRIKEYSIEDKIKFVIDMMITNIFECQYMAYDLIGNSKSILKGVKPSDIDKYHDKLHPRVLREVNNKLLKGKKN